MHAAALQAQAVQHADARLAHDSDVSRSAGTHMAQLPPLPGSDLQGDVQQRLALFVQVNGRVGGAEGHRGGHPGHRLLRADGLNALHQRLLQALVKVAEFTLAGGVGRHHVLRRPSADQPRVEGNLPRVVPQGVELGDLGAQGLNGAGALLVLGARVPGNALAGNERAGNALTGAGKRSVPGGLKAQRRKGCLGGFQQQIRAGGRADLLIRVQHHAKAVTLQVQGRQRLAQGIQHHHQAALHVRQAAALGTAVPQGGEGYAHLMGKDRIHMPHEHQLPLAFADGAAQGRAQGGVGELFHRKAQVGKLLGEHLRHPGDVLLVQGAAGLVYNLLEGFQGRGQHGSTSPFFTVPFSESPGCASAGDGRKSAPAYLPR